MGSSYTVCECHIELNRCLIIAQGLNDVTSRRLVQSHYIAQLLGEGNISKPLLTMTHKESVYIQKFLIPDTSWFEIIVCVCSVVEIHELLFGVRLKLCLLFPIFRA